MVASTLEASTLMAFHNANARMDAMNGLQILLIWFYGVPVRHAC